LSLRTIAHISDLHFGRVDSLTLPPLVAAITGAKPDVVVVSGDLTQRARKSEFSAARQFLDKLPKPQIVVPGNHDVPLYDLISRWKRPFKNFRRYIANDLEPFYADDEIAVLGINTARSLTLKNGRINARQVAESCRLLGGTAETATRVLVTHHPFDIQQGRRHDIVGRADMAMAGFARCRLDLILTGHLHVSHVRHSSARYRIAGYSALFIQAGTATSVRQRGELNAWNLIRINGGEVAVDCLTWNAARSDFAVFRTEIFTRGPQGWSESKAAKAVKNAPEQ
jgi:3',5'-cyclic AMP phosphodiesterase CpdA